MPRGDQYPWAAIQREYLEGAGPSYLAKKYGMKSVQIEQKIAREGWHQDKLRLKKEIQETIHKEAVRSVAELKTQAREIMAHILENVLKDPSVASAVILPKELTINPIVRDALKEIWKSDLTHETGNDTQEAPGFIIEPEKQQQHPEGD